MVNNPNYLSLMESINSGDFRSLARGISLIENEIVGYQELLQNTKPNNDSQVIGITGPPGAGKSTLVNELVQYYVKLGKKIAVLAVDPSSPFNQGAILGDRIRLSNISSPAFFFRSLASRGFLGGLCEKILEILELVKSAGFEVIIIETVGVGQSEIEVAGVADITVLMLVPESGDSIQSMKSGIFEIADVFVVNKFDRPGSQHFKEQILQMLHERFSEKSIEVIGTVASEAVGITELVNAFENVSEKEDHKTRLLAHKIYKLLQKKRMLGLTELDVYNELKAMPANTGSLYASLECMYNKLFTDGKS